MMVATSLPQIYLRVQNLSSDEIRMSSKAIVPLELAPHVVVIVR